MKVSNKAVVSAVRWVRDAYGIQFCVDGVYCMGAELAPWDAMEPAVFPALALPNDHLCAVCRSHDTWVYSREEG